MRNRNNKAFTIIETLVATAIVMIAIAGPLVSANRALNAIIFSRDRILASYLAQEGMEYVRLVKNLIIKDQLEASDGVYDSTVSIKNLVDHTSNLRLDLCIAGNGSGISKYCAPDARHNWASAGGIRVYNSIMDVPFLCMISTSNSSRTYTLPSINESGCNPSHMITMGYKRYFTIQETTNQHEYLVTMYVTWPVGRNGTNEVILKGYMYDFVY